MNKILPLLFIVGISNLFQIPIFSYSHSVQDNNSSNYKNLQNHDTLQLPHNSITNTSITASQCQCVEISLCNQTNYPGNASNYQPAETLGQVSNSQGSDIFGIVDLRANINQCRNESEVCCKRNASEIPQQNSKNDSSVPVPVPPNSGSWKPNRCGQFEEGQDRFRWMVSVGTESNGGYKFLCYGSLIHPSVVLTTANCVFEPANSGVGNGNIRVALQNSETINKTISRSDNERYVVREVVFHENLYRKRYEFDLALLILEKELVRSSELDTVCLPSFDMTDATHFENMICTSTLERDDSATELNKIEIFILTRDQCIEKLKNPLLGNSLKLHKSLICAEVNNPTILAQKVNGSCEIGKGSPLVCKHRSSGYFIQVGIASWNLNICDNKTAPLVVYVNLPSIGSWIRSKMEVRHFDTKYSKLVDDDLLQRILLLKP